MRWPRLLAIYPRLLSILLGVNFWQLVAVWCNNLTPQWAACANAYASLLNSLSLMLMHDLTLTPDITVSRLGVDVFIMLNALTHKSHDAKALLSSLDINGSDTLDNLFSQSIGKTWKIIYQVHEPSPFCRCLNRSKQFGKSRLGVFAETKWRKLSMTCAWWRKILYGVISQLAGRTPAARFL